MSEMWAKGYLTQIQMANIAIGQLENEKNELWESMISLPGLQYGDRVQSSSIGDQIPNQISKYLEMVDKINAKKVQLSRLRHQIVWQIQALDRPEYVDLLYKKYVEDKSFEQIAVDMGYTYSWIKHLHKKALIAFETKHPKTPKDVI